MKKLYISSFLLLACLFINAQNNNLDIKSPDAASLGRYGEYPISYSNGTIDVNVPLYTLSDGGISSEIKLNYDTTGLRINDPSSSVGQNWSISSGGVITRRTNKLSDEIIFDGNPAKGFFYNHSFLNTSQVDTDAGLSDFKNAGTNDMSLITFDNEPDDFTFNFMGKTGKFFLGNDGKWKVQSEDNLIIEIKESDFRYPFGNGNPVGGYQSKSIGKIIITDDQGYIYTFGSTDSSTEYTCDSFYGQKASNSIFASAWYLNEVKDRLGKVLYTFNYIRDKPIAYIDPINSHPKFKDSGSYGAGSLIHPVYLSSIITKDTTVNFSYSNKNALDYSNDASLEETFNNLKYITTVDSNGTSQTVFNPNWADRYALLLTNFGQGYSPVINPSDYLISWKKLNELLQWKKLDKISIVKNHGTLSEDINLHYNENTNQRLFLTKVKFTGKTGNINDGSSEYNFEYNNTSLLPSKYTWMGISDTGTMTCGTEYLLNQTSSGLFSLTTDNMATPCGDIASRYAMQKTGMLSKIFFPTKGFMALDYEPNEYSKYVTYGTSSSFYVSSVGTNRLKPGLRIKKIYKVPDINKLDREEIRLKYISNYYSNNSSGIFALSDSPIMFNHQVGQSSNISNNPLVAKASYYGPQVTYSTVFEEKYNFKNAQEEKIVTEYNFTNYDQYNDSPYLSTLDAITSWGNANTISSKHSDKSFMRGKIISKKEYDKNFVLLRSHDYYYRTDLEQLEKHSVKAFDATNFRRHTYKKYFGDFDAVKEIKRNYFPSGQFITTEVSYNKSDYPFENNSSPLYTGTRRLNEVKTLYQSGEEDKNTLEYLYNCANGNCYDELYGLIKNTKSYTNNSLISQEDITYKTINSNPKSLVIDQKSKTFYGTNLAEKIKYTKYDAYGNPLEYQKENGNYFSLIFDDKGSKLLAKIEGFRYDDLASYIPNITQPYISSSSDIQSNLSDPVAYANAKDIELRGYITNMRNNLPNAMITSYTYDSYDRLKTLTDYTGITNFYEYDGLGRLLKIKDSEGKTLKEFTYGFSNNSNLNYPYYLEPLCNIEKKVVLVKKNCTGNLVGDAYIYTIPANTYCSYTNSQDVNTQISNDISTNGQNAANQYGNCVSPSSSSSFMSPLSTITNGGNSYISGGGSSGTIYLKFSPNMNFINWNNGSLNNELPIGKVSDGQKPPTTKYGSYHEQHDNIDRYWGMKIDTNGYVYVWLTGGTSFSSSETINIPFIYN